MSFEPGINILSAALHCDIGVGLRCDASRDSILSVASFKAKSVIANSEIENIPNTWNSVVFKNDKMRYNDKIATSEKLMMSKNVITFKKDYYR